jgi:rare lipoprotein A
VNNNRAVAATHFAAIGLYVPAFLSETPVSGLLPPRKSQSVREVRVPRLADVNVYMNFRSIRGAGSLFAFFALVGCAVPPGAQDQANSAPLSTKPALANLPSQTLSPQGFEASKSAKSSKKNDSSLADAEPITSGPDIGDFEQTGRASFYGRGFHGRKTASGERFDMHALTAAHRTLPLGSYVRVSIAGTSRSVVVKINDRGPYARGRVLDLSYAAAKALGMAHAGTARVTIEGLTQAEARDAQRETVASNSDQSASK